MLGDEENDPRSSVHVYIPRLMANFRESGSESKEEIKNSRLHVRPNVCAKKSKILT